MVFKYGSTPGLPSRSTFHLIQIQTQYFIKSFIDDSNMLPMPRSTILDKLFIQKNLL